MSEQPSLVFRGLILLALITAMVATSSTASSANLAGDLLYVSSWDGNIYRVDLSTGNMLTINAGLFQPEDVAVNSKGQVFVTEVGAPRITRFEADGSGRTVIQLPFCCPEGSSFDVFDNLYFNTNEPHSGVWSITGGDPNNSPVQVVPQFASRGEGTTFLPNGDILAVDIAGVVVRSSPPSFGSYSVFANTTQIIGIDANSAGRVCVTDREPVNAVECFDKNGTPLGALATGFNVPRHSEFDTQGNFYVGNFLGNNVVKVTPQGQVSIIAQVFRAHGIGIFHRETPALTVSIDIKPGSDPNSINVRSQGPVPVAILTTTDFDAVTVNASTVRFGRTGIEAAPVQSALEDVDGDGDLDMTLKFNVQDTGFMSGDTQGTLTGRTFDGISITGTDSVRAFFPGDVDGDSDVDIFDAAMLGYAYGSVVGDSRWTPGADFDGNGIIDILDAALLGYYFDQHE